MDYNQLTPETVATVATRMRHATANRPQPSHQARHPPPDLSLHTLPMSSGSPELPEFENSLFSQLGSQQTLIRMRLSRVTRVSRVENDGGTEKAAMRTRAAAWGRGGQLFALWMPEWLRNATVEDETDRKEARTVGASRVLPGHFLCGCFEPRFTASPAYGYSGNSASNGPSPWMPADTPKGENKWGYFWGYRKNVFFIKTLRDAF